MSSNESTKLLLTAVGAAIAGAGMAVAVLKYSPARYSAPKDEEPSFPPLQQKRTSFIYENNASSSNSVIFPHNHEERMRRQITARAAVEEDNFMPRDSVTVRVPATSANMGPGCKYYFLLCRNVNVCV
jgi:homoserine kinase